MMSTDPFSDLAPIYEAMIDWPRRLANEEPLYRWLIERTAARRAVDVACGTGHHATLLHSWGLHVQGADLSPAMIDTCRARYPESPTLNWQLRGYDQPIDDTPFDLALCVGNSLALAPSEEVIRNAIRQMLAALKPGGAMVIQTPNLWKMDDGQPVWQKCVRTTLPEGERLIIKGIHRAGDRGYVDLLITDLTQNPPKLRSDCVPFRGLDPAILTDYARQAGATNVDVFGTYQRSPYARTTSPDLILVGWK